MACEHDIACPRENRFGGHRYKKNARLLQSRATLLKYADNNRTGEAWYAPQVLGHNNLAADEDTSISLPPSCMPKSLTQQKLL